MEPTATTRRRGRLRLRGATLAILLSLLATVPGCANCPIKLPGAPPPAVPAPVEPPDAWFRNLSRIDPRSLLDENGRVRHPLPEGVDFFCMQDEDVAVVPVPGAVATWGDVSLARDGDAMRPGMVNTRTVGHHSLDRLREDGIFVGDSDADRAGALAEMMRVAPRAVGVPAFIPVVGQHSDDWPAVVVTPEVLVRFRPAVLENSPGATPRERADRIAAGWGTDVVEVNPVDPLMYVVRVRGLDPAVWLRVAREIQTSPATDGLAHPNLMVHRTRSLDDSGEDASNSPPQQFPLNDPLLPRQWHLQQIGAIEAWTREGGQSPLGNPNVVVAILDPNGVEVTHEDLTENAAGHAHWNFDAKTADPQMRKSVDDGHYGTSEHGTAAAGLAVGRGGNGIGISGVAPNCGLMGICLGPTMRDDVWAIDHAWKNGAAVISNSWSYDVGVNVPDALRCAIARARALGRDGKGCVVLFSLTNENKNNFAARRANGAGTTCDIDGAESQTFGWTPPTDAVVNIPADEHTGWRPIASSPGVMSIGRATNTGVWGNCGFGPGMSLLGPGQSTLATPTKECSWDRTAVVGDADIVTCDLSGALEDHAGYNWGTPEGQKPAGCACRLMALRGTAESDTALEVNDGNYTACFKGTSAAAPIVAGVAALVISENPELTGDEVREILETTAQPIERDRGDYVWDEARKRWYSPTRGHGLVDALAAVEEARRRRLDKVPRLSLEKTAPAEAYANRPFSFTLTVRNTGKVPADDVTVTDAVPAGVEFVSASSSGAKNDANGDVVWLLGTLQAGQERTLTLTCIAAAPGAVRNLASASAVDADEVEATAAIDVLPPPSLVVDVTGPDGSYVGRAAEWVVTLTNESPDPARGVRITAELPDGADAPDAERLGAGTFRATVAGSRIVWDIGELEPGAVAEVTYGYLPLRAGTLVTAVTATANGAEPVTFESELAVRDIPASLSLQVSDIADPIWIGDEVTYLIDVRNQSTTAEHDIVIEATLAPEQEFASAQSANGAPHTFEEGVVRFEPLAELAGGARAVYRVIVKASAEGDVRFGVRLTARSLSGPVEETESTHQE